MVGGASSREATTVGAERTPNIHAMSVTLDVSRRSDWLNADAYCRVKREA